MTSFDNVKDLAKYRLIKTLYNGSIPFDELMSAYDIRPILADISPRVYGFIYRARSGRYYIVINKHLNLDTQRKIFLHELYHIIHDCPQKQYIIGLDMHRHKNEKAADLFFSLVAAAMEK